MKLFSHGILGMNARNLRYIRSKNSAESISLADSKLKTKNFLSNRGIPFAETYATLRSQQELKDFSLASIKTDHFVVKPNRGSGGQGILIVRRIKDEYKIEDEMWTEDEVKLHMTDILHGSFSLHGSSDTVVIEELLSPGTDFAHYCQYGLADIRVIVFNYIPVTAMIRMPTVHSGGKANLAQGGIGLGLNIANGQIISLFQDKEIYTYSFPSEHDRLRNKILPFWDEILLFSSQVQMYTKLGYLALDWVITKNGPKLLEINARAGLEIQNVNLVPLAARLEKIGDIKVLTPEKGVEIAKTLFHTETLSSSLGKKILYLEQKGTVGDREVVISIDLTKKESIVSKDIIDIASSPIIHIITDTNVSISLEHFEVSTSCDRMIILGRDATNNYLIDTTSSIPSGSKIGCQKWTKELIDFDNEVYKVGKRANLSSLLKPDNYFELLDRFIRTPYGYNPVFEYHFPSTEKIEFTKDLLKTLTEKSHQLEQSGLRIASLYTERLSEIEAKIGLVEAYKNEDFEKILHYNTVLFGVTDPDLLSIAREKVFSAKGSEKNDEDILGRVLSLDEVIGHIHTYFDSYDIQKIPITIATGNLSRMSVSYGKAVRIHISKNAVIREKEVDTILAHEIGTHFRRYLAGSETGLKIFRHGTGYYLADEEGLAIYRSFAHLPKGYEKNAMYMKYYLLATVDTLSFSETIELLRSLYPEKPLESLFSDAVRLKRGITHAGTKGIPGTTYQKDKIYLDGYMRVKRWIENGGDQDKLFYGKIKIQDLGIIELL